ncbi:glycosyltransferase [Acinetobacter sp. YH16039]|uniref:CgeB family protein n=1 Tax=Acinetobacter sp. YH16039 TaxID=2601184 RepID=UPI001C552AFC|nr:glycosyltransferase [Acinetobacter sp. YH16039]
MKILSVANFSNYNDSNTALHRHWALMRLGAIVDKVDTSISYNFRNKLVKKLFNLGWVQFYYSGTDIFNENIILKAKDIYPDIIWIDKGIGIKKETLIRLKKDHPKIIIIGYSPDEMTKRHNQSREFLESLPYYDAYITTKSYAVENLKRLGAKQVYFVNNAYEEKFHYPRELNNNDRENLKADVGFIGMWEKNRAESIIYLAKKGLKVRVWGGGRWLLYQNKIENLIIEDKALFSEEYSKALSAIKINLCFLRKMNNDLQTTRTMEIPACGGFMLAERTQEHEQLFVDEKEAVFFSTNQELYEKCMFYLSNENIRTSIAQAGYQKCLSAGYSNYNTLKSVIERILNDR